MLCRQKPENIENFIMVNGEVNKLLQDSGKFLPMFLYKGQFFYEKSDELIKFIREGGEMFERVRIFC